MIKTRIHFLMLFVFMLFVLVSCSNSTEKAKETEPNKENSQAVIATPVDLARSLCSDITTDEFFNTSSKHGNTYTYIANACGYYQYSHGVLPQKLSDLLDGFIVAWPRCVYTNQPIKEINTMPDPENPEHIGKVYYERIDDFSGNICYLAIDVSSFHEGNPKWGVEKQGIRFLVFNEKTRKGSFPNALAEMPPAKRQNIAYRVHLFYLFQIMLEEQIERTGTIANSFDGLFYDNGFCLFRNGIENLRKEIASGNADFELGHCSATQENIYYHSGTIPSFESLSLLGTGVLEKSGPIGLEPEPCEHPSEGHLYIASKMPIREDICKPVIHFSSTQFNSYTFRDEVLIDPEDVL